MSEKTTLSFTTKKSNGQRTIEYLVLLKRIQLSLVQVHILSTVASEINKFISMLKYAKQNNDKTKLMKVVCKQKR